jgi:hypothetical protein
MKWDVLKEISQLTSTAPKSFRTKQQHVSRKNLYPENS